MFRKIDPQPHVQDLFREFVYEQVKFDPFPTHQTAEEFMRWFITNDATIPLRDSLRLNDFKNISGWLKRSVTEYGEDHFEFVGRKSSRKYYRLKRIS